MNSGEITIGNSAVTLTVGIENKGAFTQNGGLLKINRTSSLAIKNTSIFDNFKTIEIGLTNSVGTYGIQNSGNLNNKVGAILTVKNTTGNEIRNESGATFTVSGTVHLK